METLGVLIITLLFIGLFASLCTWHCSIVEELEINGDKENLIETIKIILGSYTICVSISLLFATFFGITSDINIMPSRLLDLILAIFTLLFPLIALIGYICLIVKEVMQINDCLFDSYYIISLVLIAILGIISTGIGFLSCGIASLR